MIPKNLLPEGSQYFIAGGWAACPALAQDRDVFVQTTGDLDNTRAMLLDHLRAHEFDFEEQSAQDDHADYAGILSIAKVAKVKIKLATDIHLLVTNGDPSDIIESFDISTCQVAITSSGRILRGSGFTAPHIHRKNKEHGKEHWGKARPPHN